MQSEQLSKLIVRLQSLGKMKFLSGATVEQIEKFEVEKGINLPTQYKAWLLLADGGEFFLPAGVQLYGVAHKPIIDIDEDDRPDSSYTVIGALSTGDPVLCKKGSEEIAIYNHEGGRIEDDEIYSDFLSFLDGLPEMLGIEG